MRIRFNDRWCYHVKISHHMSYSVDKRATSSSTQQLVFYFNQCDTVLHVTHAYRLIVSCTTCKHITNIRLSETKRSCLAMQKWLVTFGNRRCMQLYDSCALPFRYCSWCQRCDMCVSYSNRALLPMIITRRDLSWMACILWQWPTVVTITSISKQSRSIREGGIQNLISCFIGNMVASTLRIVDGENQTRYKCYSNEI